MSISKALLRNLNEALLHRKMAEGHKLLQRLRKDSGEITPDDPLATAALLCLAQWIDTGYANYKILDAPLARFAKTQSTDLKFIDYVRLKMIEGFRAFAHEDIDTAVDAFAFVLQIGDRIADSVLLAQTHFWKGRAHRSKGEYVLALQHLLEAKKAAEDMGAPKFVAAIKIHESWLLFQRGQRKDAFRLLDEAEAELKTTGHYLSLGNIESARGRFVRRSGEYSKALAHFERAVEIYSRQVFDHPNMARALTNAAYVKRLIALDLRERSNTDRAKAAQHARFIEICQDALRLLERAGEIYMQHSHASGSGAVCVNAAHLHLDCGDIDLAEEKATEAFRFGEERNDCILMARACTLQAHICHERAEEQIGDSTDTAMYANRAKMFAEEAIDIAKKTQNKRLLAGAYIVRSIVATGDFFLDWETAKQFAAQAGELLSREDRDHLSKELGQLKTRILGATGIHDMLRSWSEGIVENKTFQQITEEFAEIVIPKVWLREDRKISRVAEKLSISPKKVRRILRNANLLADSS
jgi:tetratricopeptide (TPR) repeat protein